MLAFKINYVQIQADFLVMLCRYFVMLFAVYKKFFLHHCSCVSVCVYQISSIFLVFIMRDRMEHHHLMQRSSFRTCMTSDN